MEEEVFTGQTSFLSCEGYIFRCQGRKPNSLLHVLHGFRTGLLDPSSSLLPDLLVDREPTLYVVGEVVLVGEDDAERGSILDCLTRSLGLKRLIVQESQVTPFWNGRVGVTHQHWVCGVAHNAHFTLVPIFVRLVSEQPPGHAVDGVLD